MTQFLRPILLLTALAGAAPPALAWQALPTGPIPAPASTARTLSGVDVARDTLDSHAGTYVIRPGFEVRVWREGETLLLQATGQDAWPLIAESESVFVVPAMAARISFSIDARGQADQLVMYMDGKETRALRR